MIKSGRMNEAVKIPKKGSMTADRKKEIYAKYVEYCDKSGNPPPKYPVSAYTADTFWMWDNFLNQLEESFSSSDSHLNEALNYKVKSQELAYGIASRMQQCATYMNGYGESIKKTSSKSKTLVDEDLAIKRILASTADELLPILENVVKELKAVR